MPRLQLMHSITSEPTVLQSNTTQNAAQRLWRGGQIRRGGARQTSPGDAFVPIQRGHVGRHLPVVSTEACRRRCWPPLQAGTLNCCSSSASNSPRKLRIASYADGPDCRPHRPAARRRCIVTAAAIAEHPHRLPARISGDPACATHIRSAALVAYVNRSGRHIAAPPRPARFPQVTGRAVPEISWGWVELYQKRVDGGCAPRRVACRTGPKWLFGHLAAAEFHNRRNGSRSGGAV